MRLFTKILESGVIKYFVIICIGMVLVYGIQTLSTPTENTKITREALHANDSASLDVFNFEKRHVRTVEEISYDFTKKVEEKPIENLEFNNYDLTNEELYQNELFDASTLNRIVIVFILITIIGIVIFMKRGRTWKSMEM